MRNYPEWITSFVAITSVGAIAVAINSWWTTEEVDYGLRDSGAKVLIGDRERIEVAQSTLRDAGIAAVMVRSDGEPPAEVDRLDDVLRPDAPMPDVDIAPDDDATILYTSGTTGSPKGAVATHRGITNALMGFGCRSAVDRVRRRRDEGPSLTPAFILIVPLFHATGLIPVMLGTFLSGLKLVIMYKWDPERALELIEREDITNFVGVPTMSWDLLHSPDFDKRDTSSLRSVGGGGAPAPPELVKNIDAGFPRGRPTIGYGMTETCAYGPQNQGDDYVTHPTSSGRVTPILELQIIDADGRALPAGERGEICFKGPNVIRCYWNKPEATAEAIVDGWMRSGDIGYLDEEGFIYVEDRAKDMVIRAGENIYCAEVEGVIYEHPAVYEAAVFGLPHDRLGEEVAAAVMPKPGQDIDPDELREFLGQHLAAFKIPSHVEVATESLPRNAAGKILKRAIRDEILARVEAGDA